MYKSRIYQHRAKDAALETFEGGTDSTLIVMPTGTGKTTLSAMLIEEFHAMTGRRSLFAVHRENLVNQAAETFTTYGLDTCVEMAGQHAMASDAMFGKSQVVAGSVQTMQGDRLKSEWDRDEFGLVIVDEAHHDDDQHQKVIDYFQNKYLLGITATPKPELGSLYKTKCFDYKLGVAINGDGAEDPGGWLVPPIIKKAMVSVDLRGVRTSGGEFNAGDVEERLYRSMNEIVDAVHQRCGDRQMVQFMPDCGSAQAFADLMTRKYGRKFEYVAGTGGKYGMSKAERKDKLDRFRKREFQGLVNAELLFEGYDCPEIKCIGIGRPISLAMIYRYIQMVGRGLRPAPWTGFHDCIVIDLDWEADDAARNLAMVVDLYASDDISDEVMNVARLLEAALKQESPTETANPEEIIEEAEEIVRVRTKLQIRVNQDITTCKTIEITPITVAKTLDMKFSKRHDMDSRGQNPVTEAQVWKLNSLGIQKCAGISKWGASKLIKKLVDRQEAGLASLPQVTDLLGWGVNGEIARSMTAASALTSLSELKRMEAAAAKIQGSLFK